MQDWLNTHLAALDALIADAEALLPTLTPEQLNRKPNPKKWSPAEVLDHCLLAGGSYIPQLERLLAQSDKYRLQGAEPAIRFTFGGKLFYSFVRPDGRAIPTVGKFKPTASSYAPEIVDRYLEYLKTTRARFAQFQGWNLNRPRLRPQAFPLVSFTLGEYLRIEVSHQRRHFQQIQRLVG